LPEGLGAEDSTSPHTRVSTGLMTAANST
jgi:hypothetical protein